MANYILSKADLDPSGQFSGSIENDTIEIEDSSDTISYRILGLSGEDSIVGAWGKDILFGMDGNDIIFGDLEDDIIYGNEGNDTLNGAFGDDIVYGGQGNDYLSAAGRFNVLDDKVSFLYGNLGDDTVIASSLRDPFGLFGGQGKDSLSGAPGDDTVSGDRGQDVLAGGGGNDTLIIGKTANASEIPTGTENADLLVDFINGEDKIGLVGVTFEQLLISEIQPPQIDAIFGAGSVENSFDSSIIKFLKVEAGGELLAIVGRDRDNFTLTASDFIII